MPVMMTTRRPLNNTGSLKNNNSADSIRVKVKDCRRKQQWLDPLPTPPRSPHSDLLESEPIMDDLFALWNGSGLLDDVDETDQKFTLDAALNELGFTEDEQRHSSCSGTFRRISLGDIDAEGLLTNFPGYDDGDLFTDGDNEELLNHLLNYVSEDSPPPTNPPSPPAPEDMEIDNLDTIINSATHELKMKIKTEINSGPSSLDGDSADECNRFDEAFSSDSGIDEGGNDMSPTYDDAFLNEDFLNADSSPLFADNTFDALLEASKLSHILEEPAIESELKQDCMWNGVGCQNLQSTDIKPDLSLLYSSNSSPKFGLFDEFMKAKVKVEPKRDETAKVEPVDVHLQEADLGHEEEDAMFWKSEPLWAEEATPPVSQDPVIPPEADEFKGLSWTDLIDDTKERYELERLRNATLNDHSYANIHRDPKPPTGIFEFPRKGFQGIKVLKEGNGDDYSGGPGPKRTKILVPLKDLMASLQNQHFIITPDGPGRKVVRLANSESVKGLAAFASSFKPVSSYGVPQTTLFHRSINGQNRSVTKASLHSITGTMTATSPTSTGGSHTRVKKSKANRSIMREGGTITFPDQVPSPSSPESLSESSSSTSSSSNLTASGRPKKTKTHNNMERMRRIDLRNSFDSLKKLVPPLAKSTKCSKVEILRRAEEYIRALKSLEKRLQREEAAVRSKNESLKLKLLQSQQ